MTITLPRIGTKQSESVVSFGGYWQLLNKYLLPQRARMTLLAVLLFSSIALKIAMPQAIRVFVDAAQSQAAMSVLLQAGGAYLGVALLVQVLSVAAVYFSEMVGWTATNNLRADLALHCLRLDMTFHNVRTPGEMVERVDGDVMDLSIFFSQMVIQVFGSLVLMLAVLVAVAFESLPTALLIGAVTVVGGLVMNKCRVIAEPAWKLARDAHSDMYGFLEEHLSGMEDIRSSGAADFTLRSLLVNGRRVISTESKAGVIGIYMWIVWCAWEVLGRASAFVASYLLWSSGQLTTGGVFLMIFYVETMFTPLRMLVAQMETLQKAGASIQRLREMLSLTTQLDGSGTTTLPRGPLGVAFENVTFAYNAAKPVLNGVSFTLQPGHVLGVLGRTGSGKTTLARLIFRLYDVTGGSVSLTHADGVTNLRNVALDKLPQSVSMVTQDVQVFRASIRNNLTLFDRTIPDAGLLEVIEDLGLGAWFANQPAGLDTELESGGKNLSAGEAQLLAFGRVFLRSPGLVVMDEASSRLDPVTEARIEHAVDRLLGDRARTALIIAHRLATVLRADDILIIENGLVAEFGPRAALQADENSRFSALLRTAQNVKELDELQELEELA